MGGRYSRKIEEGNGTSSHLKIVFGRQKDGIFQGTSGEILSKMREREGTLRVGCDLQVEGDGREKKGMRLRTGRGEEGKGDLVEGRPRQKRKCLLET